MKRRDYLARAQTLQAELAMAKRELERVAGQRDELRRVLGDVRSYARQEAERAVADNLSRRDARLALEKRPPWALARDDTALSARPQMRPTVALAAHLSDPVPPDSDRPVLDACYHPAEDSSMEAFWHRCHGTHKPCPDEGHRSVPR